MVRSAAACAVLVLCAAGAAHARDIDVLNELYSSTNGPAWKDNQGWTTAFGDVCTWWGVSCDGGGDVSGLVLSGNGLRGTIPNSLALLNLSMVDLCVAAARARVLGATERVGALPPPPPVVA